MGKRLARPNPTDLSDKLENLQARGFHLPGLLIEMVR